MLNARCESNDDQNFQVVMVESCSYHVLGFDTAVFYDGISASEEHVASIFRRFMALQNVSVNLQYCVMLETKRVQCESDGLLLTYYLIISLNTAGKCESYLGWMIQTRMKPEAFPAQESVYQGIAVFHIISNISSLGLYACLHVFYQFPCNG
jgi:hypothetical protein